MEAIKQEATRTDDREFEIAELEQQLNQSSRRLAALNELQLLLSGYCPVGFEAEQNMSSMEKIVLSLLLQKNQTFPSYSSISSNNEKMPDTWHNQINIVLAKTKLSKNAPIDENNLRQILATLNSLYSINIDNLHIYTSKNSFTVASKKPKNLNSSIDLKIVITNDNCWLLQPKLNQSDRILEILMLHTNALELFFAQPTENKVAQLRQTLSEGLSRINNSQNFSQLNEALFTDKNEQRPTDQLLRKVMDYLVIHADGDAFLPFKRSCAYALENVIHQALVAKITHLKSTLQDESLNQLENKVHQLELEIEKKAAKLAQQNEQFEANVATIRTKRSELNQLKEMKQQQLAELDQMLTQRQASLDSHASEYAKKQTEQQAADKKFNQQSQQQAENMEKARDLTKEKQELERQRQVVNQQITDLQKNIDALADQKARAELQKNRSVATKDAIEQNKIVMDTIKAFASKIRELAISDNRFHQHRDKILQKLTALRDEAEKLNLFKEYLVKDLGFAELAPLPLPKLGELKKEALEKPIFHEYVNHTFALFAEILRPTQPGSYDAGEYCFTIQGFDVTWSDCKKQLEQHIRSTLAVYGLEFNTDADPRIVADKLIGSVNSLPEPLIKLIEERLHATRRPDLFPSQDSAVKWHLRTAGEHEKAEIIAGLNAAEMQLTLSAIMPYFIHRVNVTAGNHIYVDENIRLAGIDLTLIAHHHIYLNKNCVIDTSGEHAMEFMQARAREGDDPEYQQRDANEFRGRDGEHGLFGLAGMPGGHIHLSATGEIFHKATLTCHASGGRGAKGQEGGHGGQGKEGASTPPANADPVGTGSVGNTMDSIFAKGGSSETVIAEARIPGVGPNQETESEQSIKERSGVGGHGGKGGRGGFGGVAGEIKIVDKFSGSQSEVLATSINQQGAMGPDPQGDAKGGKAGEPGFLGISTANSNDGPKKKSKGIRGALGGKKHTDRTRHGYYDLPKIIIREKGHGLMGFRVTSASHYTSNYSHQYKLSYWKDHLPETGGPSRSTDRRSICGEDRSQQTYGLASEQHRQQKKGRANKMADENYRRHLEQQVRAGATLESFSAIEADHDARSVALSSQLESVEAEIAAQNLALENLNGRIGEGEQQKAALQNNQQRLQQEIARVDQNQLANQVAINQTAEALLASLAELNQTGMSASNALVELQKAQRRYENILRAKAQYDLQHRHQENATHRELANTENSQADIMSTRQNLEQNLTQLRHELRVIKQRYVLVNQENRAIQAEIDTLQAAITEIQEVATQQVQTQLTAESEIKLPDAHPNEKLWQESDSQTAEKVVLHVDALAEQVLLSIGKNGHESGLLIASVQAFLNTGKLDEKLFKALINWLAQYECEQYEIALLWEIASRAIELGGKENIITPLCFQIEQASFRWLMTKTKLPVNSEKQQALWSLLQATLNPGDIDIQAHRAAHIDYCASLYQHLADKIESEPDFDAEDLYELLEFAPAFCLPNAEQDQSADEFTGLLQRLRILQKGSLFATCDLSQLDKERVTIENLAAIIHHTPVPASGTVNYRIYCFFARLFVRDCGESLKANANDPAILSTLLRIIIECLLKIGRAGLLNSREISAIIDQSLQQVSTLTTTMRAELISSIGADMKSIESPSEERHVVIVMLEKLSQQLDLIELANGNDIKPATSTLAYLKPFGLDQACLNKNLTQFLNTLRITMKAHTKSVQVFLQSLIDVFTTYPAAFNDEISLKFMLRVSQLIAATKVAGKEQEDERELANCKQDLLKLFPVPHLDSAFIARAGKADGDQLNQVLMQLIAIAELELANYDWQQMEEHLNALKLIPNLSHANYVTIMILDDHINAKYTKQVETHIITLQEHIRKFQTEMLDLDDLVARFVTKDTEGPKQKFIEYCVLQAKIALVPDIAKINSLNELINKINDQTLSKACAALNSNRSSVTQALTTYVGLVDGMVKHLRNSSSVNYEEMTKQINTAITFCNHMIAPLEENQDAIYTLYNNALYIQEYLEMNEQQIQTLDSHSSAHHEALLENLAKLEFSLKTFCHKPNLFQGYNFLIAEAHSAFYGNQAGTVLADHPLAKAVKAQKTIVEQLPIIKKRFGQFTFLAQDGIRRKSLFDRIMSLMPKINDNKQPLTIDEKKAQELVQLLASSPNIALPADHSGPAGLQYYARVYEYLLSEGADLSLTNLVEVVKNLQETRTYHPNSFYYARLAVLLSKMLINSMNLTSKLSAKLRQLHSFTTTEPDGVLVITQACAMIMTQIPEAQSAEYVDYIFDDILIGGIHKDLEILIPKATTGPLAAQEKDKLLFWLAVTNLYSQKGPLLAKHFTHKITENADKILFKVQATYLHELIKNKFAAFPEIFNHLEALVENISEHLASNLEPEVFSNVLALYQKIRASLEQFSPAGMTDSEQISCADIFKPDNFEPAEQEEITSLVMMHHERAYWQSTIQSDKKPPSYTQPIMSYLPTLKSQYWLDLCQRWFDVELAKVKDTDNYNDWLIKLVFTDRLQELNIAYDKLRAVSKDKVLMAKLNNIYECKKHLIFSYSLSIANMNEIAWLELIDTLDGLVQNAQMSLADANKLLSLAVKHDLYHEIPAVLAKNAQLHPVQAVLIDNLRLLAGAKEAESAIAQSSAFNQLRTNVFKSENGLNLLEIIFAAFATANRENYVIGLTKLNQLVEQIVKINLFDRPELHKLFASQPILIWHSLLDRIQLADRLGLDSMQASDLLEELLTIKEHISITYFDRLVAILHQHFGPKQSWLPHFITGDLRTDQKMVVSYLRELSEDFTLINDELLVSLAQKPLKEWSVILNKRSIDSTARDMNKLIVEMRNAEINNDPIMAELLQVAEPQGKCRMQYLYDEVQAQFQAEFSQCDEATLKDKLAKFLQTHRPLLSENMKGDGKELLFDRQLITLLALIQRAVQLREPKYRDDQGREHELTFYPNQLAALISFIDSIRHSRSLIANIDTGQGKSLITRVMAIIHVLRGEKVDIISSGKHLAERDAENSKALCEFFAIKVTNNCDAEASASELIREERYNQHQIIYGDTGSFQMDYLLSRYLDRSVRKNQSDRLLVDEVDSAILDSMDKVLYISHTLQDLHNIAEIYYEIWRLIHLENFEFPTPINIQHIIDAISKQCGLDEKAESVPVIAIPAPLKKFVSRRLRIWVENAYTAKFMKDNEQYSEVKNGQYANKVLINDTNTGVEQVNSQWSNGLHQFLQIKHLKAVSDESLRAVFISNKTYFSMYSKGGKMQGLSGTVGSQVERKLQNEIYQVGFAQIPRNIPRNHRVKAGVVNATMEYWYDRIIQEILDSTGQNNPKRRAALVVFQYKSQVTELIKRITAKYPDLSKDIIQYSSYIENQVDTDKVTLTAGKIIIATNIAGRGTDLKLAKQVIDNGGLHLIKTYIPEKSRTDIQIDGRASRNDMPGSSRYIVYDGRSRTMQLTVKSLLEERNELERIACARIRETQVPQLNLEETLMHRYAALRADLKKLLTKQCDNHMLEIQLTALQNAWSYWFDKNSEFIKNVNKYGEEHVNNLFEQFKRKMIHKLQRNADMLIKFPSELMSIAQYHMGHKNFARAAHYFQLVIDQDPEHSGFAYYYWAQAVLEAGTSHEQKSDFIKLCKKAKLAFETANGRLQSQNIAAEEVAKRVRLSGKGASVNILSKNNADEMGMYLRHIDAIEKMIGKKLSHAAFQNGEAVDKEVTTIYRNIAAAMNKYIKDFRFSHKLQVREDATTHVKKLILARTSLQRNPTAETLTAIEREVTLPSRYFYCQDKFIQFYQQHLSVNDKKKKSFHDRQLLLFKTKQSVEKIALAEMILTKDRWVDLIKPCLKAEQQLCFSDKIWEKINTAKQQIHRRAGAQELIKKMPLDKFGLDVNSLHKLIALLNSDTDKPLLLSLKQLRTHGVAITDEQFSYLRQLLKVYGCWEFDLFGLPITLADNEQHFLRILAETLEKCEQTINLESVDIPPTQEHAVEEILNALIAQGAVKEPKVDFPKIAPSKRAVTRRLENIKGEIHQQLETILGAELYAKFSAPENNRAANLIDSISQAIESTIGTIQTIPRLEIKATDIKLFYEKGEIPPILLPYIQQGLASVLSLVEKPPKKKGNGWGAFCVAVLGAAQIVAGAIIISTCPAFAKVGEALIQQGIGDIIFAAQSYMSGNFSWDAYWKYKRQSLVISAITLGLQAGLSETGLSIPASNSVPASTFIYPAIRTAAINLAIDAATSHLLSDAEEKIAEMLADEFVKSFDQFMITENDNVQSMLTELYRIMGFADGDRALATMLSERALNQFVNEQISPAALAATREAAARISAMKSSNRDHSALSSIIAVAKLVSQLIIIPEYLNKIETIKRNTRQKLKHIKTELQSRVDSLTSRGHQPQSLPENELQAKAKDATSQFMQRLSSQIKEKVRQIMQSAGHDIFAYAIEDVRKKSMEYVSNAADNYFGMVDQLTSAYQQLDRAAEQQRRTEAQKTLNHFTTSTLQELIGQDANAAQSMKIQTMMGEMTLEQLQASGQLQGMDATVIAHNDQTYLVPDSMAESTETESFMEALQTESADKKESKEPLKVNKPGNVNTNKKKYHQNITGKLGRARDPKSGKFVKKEWDTSNQGLAQNVDKKPEIKVKLFKEKVFFEGDLLEGHQLNLLGQNSSQHIGLNPYARYKSELSGYIGKDGVTAAINFTPLDAGVNVISLSTGDKFENFKFQTNANAMSAVLAADASIALKINPMDPQFKFKLEGKAMVSALSVKTELEFKDCLNNWCFALKPEAQLHFLAAGVNASSVTQYENNRFAVTNEFGVGAGLFGFNAKYAFEIYPQQPKPSSMTVSTRSYDDIQRQLQQDQQHIIRADMGEQQYRQQVNTYGKEALNQRFFGPRGIYNTPSAYSQRLQQYRLAEKFKPNPCDSGPCIYAPSKQ